MRGTPLFDPIRAVATLFISGCRTGRWDVKPPARDLRLSSGFTRSAGGVIRIEIQTSFDQ
jgi:hypothetical protein